MRSECAFRYFLAGVDDEIKSVYDNGSKKLKAKFLSRITNLRSLDFNEWREPLFKSLHGECSGLFEIRFKSDNLQQRPIGYFSNKHEFIILLWATEKGGRFVPKNACTTAQLRIREIEGDSGKTQPLWI